MRCPKCGAETERAHCVVVPPGRAWEVVPAWRCPACREQRPEAAPGAEFEVEVRLRVRALNREEAECAVRRALLGCRAVRDFEVISVVPADEGLEWKEKLAKPLQTIKAAIEAAKRAEGVG